MNSIGAIERLKQQAQFIANVGDELRPVFADFRNSAFGKGYSVPDEDDFALFDGCHSYYYMHGPNGSSLQIDILPNSKAQIEMSSQGSHYENEINLLHYEDAEIAACAMLSEIIAANEKAGVGAHLRNFLLDKIGVPNLGQAHQATAEFNGSTPDDGPE